MTAAVRILEKEAKHERRKTGTRWGRLDRTGLRGWGLYRRWRDGRGPSRRERQSEDDRRVGHRREAGRQGDEGNGGGSDAGARPGRQAAPPRRPGDRVRPGGRVRLGHRRPAGQDAQDGGDVLRADRVPAPRVEEPGREGQHARPGSGPAPAAHPADHDSGAEEVIRPEGPPMFNQFHLGWLAVWLLRVALAFSFLSAVADRFGLWGTFGVDGVSWGNFERFTAYTGQLLWFLPPYLVSAAAILATAAEAIVAGGLLVGWRLHWWAFAAAALLLSFALAMAVALGVKAPTDYSVWTAAAAAFLVGVVALRQHGAEGTHNFDADACKQERDARARVTQTVDH